MDEVVFPLDKFFKVDPSRILNIRRCDQIYFNRALAKYQQSSNSPEYIIIVILYFTMILICSCHLYIMILYRVGQQYRTMEGGAMMRTVFVICFFLWVAEAQGKNKPRDRNAFDVAAIFEPYATKFNFMSSCIYLPFTEVIM